MMKAHGEKFSKFKEDITMQHQAMARKLRARQISLTALSIMAMMFGMGKELMAQTNASTPVKNIVLVHGGFVDGSGWQGVYKALTNDGYTVTIVQNPTISLEGDVAVTKRAIATQNGPAILVGHSYGGAVITQAGNDPKVAGLVYVTAFALDKGESVSSLLKDPPPGAPVPPILPPVDGYLLLDKAKFPAAFAGDVSPEEAAFMADSQVPWGLDALSGTVSEPAWRTKPSWYLVTTEDKMIPPDAQRAMSKRAGSTVVEVKGSHAVYVSQPQAVALFIEKAAKGALVAGKEQAAAGPLAAAK
jgi:pimeloyl-ACP methyl ester carboxylesterase